MCRCGSDTADIVLYGKKTCTDDSQIPGVTLKVTQQCYTIDPVVAAAYFIGADPLPKTMRITDSECNIPTFEFTTCGSPTCTVGGSNGCTSFILPQMEACQGDAFGAFNYATLTESIGNTVDVQMYPASDTTCTGQAIGSIDDVPVDGTTCTQFGPGGAIAGPAENVPVSPKVPASLPTAATTIKCWSGSKSATQNTVQKETTAKAGKNYCASFESKGTGNAIETSYGAVSTAELMSTIVMSKTQEGEDMGAFLNLKYCNTDYCNAPPGGGNGAASTAIAWTVGALATGVAAYMTA
jgi:hypothetical protein